MDTFFTPTSLDDLVKGSATVAPYAMAMYKQDATEEQRALSRQAQQYLADTREAIAAQNANLSSQAGFRNLALDMAKEGAQWDKDLFSSYSSHLEQAGSLGQKVADLKLQAYKPPTPEIANYQAGIDNIGMMMLSFPGIGKLDPNNAAAQQSIRTNIEQSGIMKKYIGEQERYYGLIQNIVRDTYGKTDQKEIAGIIAQHVNAAKAEANPGQASILADIDYLTKLRDQHMQLAGEMAKYSPNLTSKFDQYLSHLTGQAPGQPGQAGQAGQQVPMLYLGTADGKDLYVNPKAYGGYVQGGQTQLVPTRDATPQDLQAIQQFNAARAKQLKLEDAMVTLGQVAGGATQGASGGRQAPPANGGQDSPGPRGNGNIPGGGGGVGDLALDANVGILLKEKGQAEMHRNKIIQEFQTRGPQAAKTYFDVIATRAAQTLGRSPEEVAPYILKHLNITEKDLQGPPART